ncbi:PTS sugar transporter subunit IIC/EAL domain-containing protein [Vibrio hepatarius]|uniref:PTS sugar transporter subunit IIC/EAL domain-containing protein n=1 Tax=Vibrio hepatarius TaxID=171383 RepID=UPI003736B8CB
MHEGTDSRHLIGISNRSIVHRLFVPSLQAIREGMVWLIPCLMLSSFALFFASIGEFFLDSREAWITHLYSLHDAIAQFFPFLMTATISYILAMQWRLPRPPTALLMITFLVIIEGVLPEGSTLLTFHIILAIITPLYAVPLLAYLLRFDFLKLTETESAGQIVKESLNMVIPAFITSLLVLAINYTFVMSLSNIALSSIFATDYANEPTLFGVIFATLNSVLWFMGIHGYYALLPLVEFLQEASNLNYSTVLAGGEAHYPMNLSFMGAFVFIGGSGATLSLVIALLVFSKQRSLKLIALASIPIGVLNINEILLFGLPIIFNPRLFFPFLLAPVINVVVSMLAVSSGLVATPSVSVPFNSPIFINAWMATQGDWAAVGLQLLNIVIGIAIYLPAVKVLNQSKSQKRIALPIFDTSYARREEEARTLMDDPIAQAIEHEKSTMLIEHELEQLSSRDFCIEYQPQVSANGAETVGCEALIRSVDKHGRLQYPVAFIPWLEQAGLMKDVDLWVFRQVIKDIKQMHKAGVLVPVSVNITPQTLVDPEYISQLEKIIHSYAQYIHIEITEESLLEDEQALAIAFNRLHKLGAKIHIDDFGTGYSSLSYLNKFELDYLKIDRSFVLALDTPKGKKVFGSIVSIAKQLDLKVIVEGVETTEQLAHIPNDSDISVQGWLYAKSLTLSRFIDYASK